MERCSAPCAQSKQVAFDPLAVPLKDIHTAGISHLPQCRLLGTVLSRACTFAPMRWQGGVAHCRARLLALAGRSQVPSDRASDRALGSKGSVKIISIVAYRRQSPASDDSLAFFIRSKTAAVEVAGAPTAAQTSDLNLRALAHQTSRISAVVLAQDASEDCAPVAGAVLSVPKGPRRSWSSPVTHDPTAGFP